MSPTDAKLRTVSERPSLHAEREAWVRNVLRKGVEFTEELLREYDELRHECLRLEQENVRLRNQVASDDAIRDLLIRIDALEHERRSLLDRSFELEVSQRQYEGRSRQVEHELNDLASLYVASYQLSACFGHDQALHQVLELLEQLVGVEQFVLYVASEEGQRMVPAAWHGYGACRPQPTTMADPVLADVCMTGMPSVNDLPRSSDGSPLAVVPLVYGGEVVAVITIERLLAHKQEWASVDHEMFKILSGLGATVLVAAGLMATGASPRSALKRLLERDWVEPRKRRDLDLGEGEDAP